MHPVPIPAVCLLIFLCVTPSLGQRFRRRHARTVSSFPEPSSGSVTTGTALPSGVTALLDEGHHNYTFKPALQTKHKSSSPSTAISTLSFNPGGPNIPVTTITISSEAQPTSSCSTTITGFFTKVAITDCSQIVTFSTKSSFQLTSTVTKAGLFRSPTTSTYAQNIVSYFDAPWKSIAEDDMRNINVIVCTYGINGIDKTCTQGQQYWEVHVNYVSIISTVTLTTTLTVLDPFSEKLIMDYGDSITLSSGVNEISTEHVVTSCAAAKSTSTSQIGAPSSSPVKATGWKTLNGTVSGTIASSESSEKSPAITAPPEVHDKIAAVADGVSYAAPPGGWAAVSYPADAGADLSSYPAPPGGWGAVSYPPDAGAGLSSYPAPPGGWGAVSYPPLGAAVPAAITSTSVSNSVAPSPSSSPLPIPTTSVVSSSESASSSMSSPTPADTTLTATATSTIRTTIQVTSTVTVPPSTSSTSPPLFPIIGISISLDTDQVDDDSM